MVDARHDAQDSFACPHEKQFLLLLSVAANRAAKEAGLYSSHKSTDLSKDVPTMSERAVFGGKSTGCRWGAGRYMKGFRLGRCISGLIER